MSPRYLLIAGDRRKRWARNPLDLARRTGLDVALAERQFALLANDSCPIVRIGEGGCVVGSLFRRHGPAEAVDCLDSGEQAAIRTQRNDALTARFWGGYVAALEDNETLRILRDPSGLLPCYYGYRDGLSLFASDAELLAASGVATGIDVPAVARQLYRAFVPSSSTALHGISELLAGFSVRLPATAVQDPCWSPWDHVGDRGISADLAADRLARTVQHCLQSWAAVHGRLLLSVSGGLDSSIIAACLARAGADFVCLTMYSEDAAGDERPFARALGRHLGLALVERPYRLEDIDIEEPLAPHLPEPRDRTQANAYERVHLDVAREVGATAFITGNGGDNVFGYSQSAASVADRFLTEGIGTATWQALVDVCRQTGCGLFEAAWQACRLANRPPARRVRPNPLLLTREFTASLDPGILDHPWLDAPAGALPGKAAHISAVLRVQPNLGAHRGAFLPFLTPLLSQPIVETCLAIPSWEWSRGGRDRALARDAFADALPAEVLGRRVKGTPGRFAARLLDHFRLPIRERLLNGRLAAAGVLDKVAVGRSLAGEGPVPDLERVRLLEMVNAEAWLDHWAVRSRRTVLNGPA